MKQFLMAIITMVAFVNAAMAAYNDSDFYINLSAGYALGSTNFKTTNNSGAIFYSPIPIGPASVFQLQNVAWQNNMGGGGEGEFAMGLDFYYNWRIECEFLYQNLTRDIDGSYDWVELSTAGGDIFASPVKQSLDDTSSQLRNYAFLLNLYYDFYNASPWTPFVGVGVGAAIINSDTTTTNGNLSVTDEISGITEILPVTATTPKVSGTPFIWQFKAGIAYRLNADASIVAQYRLLGTSELSVGGSRIITQPNTEFATTFYSAGKTVNGLLNSGFDLGIQYKFNVL